MTKNVKHLMTYGHINVENKGHTMKAQTEPRERSCERGWTGF